MNGFDKTLRKKVIWLIPRIKLRLQKEINCAITRLVLVGS